MNFCQYSDLLGKPGEGLHSIRIFNIAIVDVILTIIGAYLVSLLFKIRFGPTLMIFFILGIIVHRLFCVRTTIDKLLFLKG